MNDKTSQARDIKAKAASEISDMFVISNTQNEAVNYIGMSDNCGNCDENLENFIHSTKKNFINQLMNAENSDQTISEECAKSLEEQVKASKIKPESYTKTVKEIPEVESIVQKTFKTYDDFNAIRTTIDVLKTSSEELRTLLSELEKSC